MTKQICTCGAQDAQEYKPTIWKMRTVGRIKVGSLVRWNRKLHGVETIPSLTHCWEHPTYMGISCDNGELGSKIKVMDALR